MLMFTGTGTGMGTVGNERNTVLLLSLIKVLAFIQMINDWRLMFSFRNIWVKIWSSKASLHSVTPIFSHVMKYSSGLVCFPKYTTLQVSAVQK